VRKTKRTGERLERERGGGSSRLEGEGVVNDNETNLGHLQL
jgi:hypothetical protein